MKVEHTIQGKQLSSDDIGLIQQLLLKNPDWNRTRLSKELCLQWNWCNEKGLLKDMSCRALLLKLESRGHIKLPKPAHSGYNDRRNLNPIEWPYEQVQINSSLHSLQPLQIEALSERCPNLGLFRFLLHKYHYLGLRNCVGKNLKYLVLDCHGRPLACLLFGSAAWKAKPRDEFIGWYTDHRHRNLTLITNNTRFLILPNVKVRHLASHLLRQVSKRLNTDWEAKYGHTIELLETFVERDRFRGTCYRAAGWIFVGVTQGRSRNDVYNTLRVPMKDIYLLPLTLNFRSRLSI